MTYKSKTAKQQKNFRTLLDGMVDMYGDKRFDDHFDMDYYQTDGYDSCVQKLKDAFIQHNCETSACLLGHGPIFGIVNEEQDSLDFFWHVKEFLGLNDTDPMGSWDEYSEWFFGLGRDGYGWSFLFSSCWPDDIQEAIARLKMYIQGFDPENDDWEFSDLYASE